MVGPLFVSFNQSLNEIKNNNNDNFAHLFLIIWEIKKKKKAVLSKLHLFFLMLKYVKYSMWKRKHIY